MKKLKVFLPWNLPEYQVSNGFRDLYDFFLEEKYFEFKALRIKSFYNKKFLKVFAFFIRFNPGFKSYDKSASISYFLNKFGSLDCDLELLHTSPIFAIKNKPFVFHLEDFQTIFLHRDILNIFKKDVDLRKIFERESCVAIVSNIPETLQSFRNYFNSPIINSKLCHSKIAVSNSFIKSVNELKNFRKNPEETVFLFTSSGHQDPNNYVTRGFKIVINLAKKLIESGHKAKFIFKCAKLSKPDLLLIGLSEEQIDFINNCESIVWYEEYLSDDEMNVLYKRADFFLLPSAHLHSMSILKSMYCGAIPIVTDTVGTDQYVDHLKNGIVLKGVREAVFQDEVSLLKANLANYLDLEESLSEQLFSELVKIIDQKDLIDEMKFRAKERVLKDYSPQENAAQLSYDLTSKWYKRVTIRKRHRRIRSLLRKLINKFLVSDFRRYKQILPQKILEWENIKVFKHHSYYHIIDSKKGHFQNLTKFSKPYNTVLEINKELRKVLF